MLFVIWFTVIVLLLHHFIDRITPLIASYEALWHIGRKRVRYDNDGLVSVVLPRIHR